MKQILLATLFFLVLTPVSAVKAVMPQTWRQELADFSIKNSKHSSWGHSHGLRNYSMSKTLAVELRTSIDDDVLFAAALLHDLGGLKPFEVKGKDHAVRSAEIAAEILPRIGFPLKKVDQVQRLILDHVYYGQKPRSIASQIFRDADILDFMGIVGFSRVMAASDELDPEKKSLRVGLATFQKLSETLPAKLSTPAARKRAQAKHAESLVLIQRLQAESQNGELL